MVCLCVDGKSDFSHLKEMLKSLTEISTTFVPNLLSFVFLQNFFDSDSFMFGNCVVCSDMATLTHIDEDKKPKTGLRGAAAPCKSNHAL